MNCYRCQHSLLNITPENLDDIQFFGCRECGSQYTLRAGKQLHDRWQMPITIPLYSVIFEQEPLNKLDRVAAQIKRRKADYIKVLKEHIEEELTQPKQKVSEVHDFVYPNEEKLREFLSALLEKL